MDDKEYSDLIPQNPIKEEQITLKTSSEEISKQKEKIELARIKRKAFFEKIDDYTSFITTKIVGVGSLTSRADLSRADLSRADLSRANLKGANLSRANLQGAINLNINQVKLAQNYQKAKYSQDFWE